MFFLCKSSLIISRAAPCSHVGKYFFSAFRRWAELLSFKSLFFQVLIWLHIQRNVNVIPKPVTPHHTEENVKVRGYLIKFLVVLVLHREIHSASGTKYPLHT